MTKGGKASTRGGMDTLTWLTSVRVGDKKGDGSSGRSIDEGEEEEHRETSRIGSLHDESRSSLGKRSGSGSHDDITTVDSHQALQDE